MYGRSNDLYFNGAIDDVMIFDSELSSEEIKAMYNRGFSLGWDDNGNMTATDMINGTDTTLQYNWDNKLRSATKGTKSISLRYDPGGNRIWKESTDGAAETTHKYIVDIVGGLPTTLMEMIDSDGTILKTYIYANGQPLCQNDGDYSAPRYFYINDRLGSVRQIINTSANVVKYYTYEPFGEVLEEDGTLTNNMMFTGQYFDSEIDQYYLRARQYDPHISRFTARDPVDGQYRQPLTLHKYLYCLNDPINCIDPGGLRTWHIMSSFMGTMLVGHMYQCGFVVDDDGNWGLIETSSELQSLPGAPEGEPEWGLGLGVPAISCGIAGGWTNADTIFDLEGPGISVGGSWGMGPSIGLDYISGIQRSGEKYHGFEFTPGIGAGALAGFEGHGHKTWTKVTPLKPTQETPYILEEMFDNLLFDTQSVGEGYFFLMVWGNMP